MSAPNRTFNLTVFYIDGIARIAGANGGDGSETIWRNELDLVIYKPGTGVRSVDSFRATTNYDTRKITIGQIAVGTELHVTDANALLATDPAVEISYCISFTDSSGMARSTDPQLINRPTVNT